MGRSVPYSKVKKLPCSKDGIKKSNEKLAMCITINQCRTKLSFGIAAFLYGKVLYTYAAL